MLKIGIIGAGHISIRHLDSFQKIDGCEVKAISDINEELARSRATEFGVPDIYTDYHDLLADKEIDAVVIATPTFTHKDIVIEALNADKHVLCEKPPALNAEEAQACEEMAIKTGKLLMYGFVCRFRAPQQYMKTLIDSGKLGNLLNAEAMRVSRLGASQGWLANREKGGGVLRDECIHEIDAALWLMGYPKPKSVIATESFANSDLALKMQHNGWETFHKIDCLRNVESFVDGYVVLDNGVGLHVKASCVLNTPQQCRTIEIIGDKMGARMVPGEDKNLVVKLVELSDTEFKESYPDITFTTGVMEMAEHFIDCITKGTKCIYTPGEAGILLQIIDGLYESAKTGKPVIFE